MSAARREIEAARAFRLDVYDADRANPRDMTDSVAEVPSFTNVGSLGEVSSATVFLDAAHGWHVTRGRPGRGAGSGTAYEHARGYVIDQFTLLKMRAGRGASAYERYLEARALKPQFTSLGLFNTVEMACLERSLKDVLVPGHWWFMTYREVLDDLVSHYNAQRGTSQPELRLQDANIGDGVDLDRTTGGPINLYAGTDCFTAINLLIDRLRQPIQTGGTGELVSAFYTDYGDPPYPGIDLNLVVQGARGSSVPVIEAGTIGVSADLRQRLPASATTAIVRGLPGSGTLPMSVAHYEGRTEAFARAEPWAAGVSYAAGQLVRHRAAPAGRHHAERRWRCRAAHTSSAANAPPSSGSQTTQWQPLTEWGYLREGNDRVATDNWAYNAREAGGMWAHGTADASQSFNMGRNSVSYPDSNLVIRDTEAWADWAHYRLPAGTRIAHDAANGTRVLIDGPAPASMSNGSPSGLSATADANALVQMVGGSWSVSRRFPASPGGDVYQVNVLREGKVYEWAGTRPAADDGGSWHRHDDYAPGYLVRHVAGADDAAANADVTSGTEYVWRRTDAPPPAGSSSGLLPPPRDTGDTGRWELVGEYDAGTWEGPTVPQGYGPLRREWPGARSWVDVSSDGLVPNHCFHYPSRVALVEPLVRIPDGAPSQFARAVYVEYRVASIFGGVASAILGALGNLTILGVSLAGAAITEFARNVAALIAPQAGDVVNGILGALSASPFAEGEDLSPQAVWKRMGDAQRGILDSPQGYGNLGWWYTLFEAPLPMRGGGPFTPHYLDLNNRNMTPSGNMGWGAPDAEDLGKLTGIRFDILFDKTLGPFRAPQGNLPFRCFIMDSESNIWIQDFEVRHLGVRQDVVLSFQNFKAYTARAPINVRFWLLNALRPELRPVESLNRRQIKHIGIHLLTNYDEHGRFVPWFNPFHNILESFAAITGEVVHAGTIDNFCFVKSPIAVATRRPSENTGAAGRNIMAPVTELPISNTVQLRQAAEARAHLQAWRQDNFTVRVEGRADVLAEQSVMLKDPRIVSESDAGTGADNAGTLKLAVTRVSHSYQADGHGWFTELGLVRRINRMGGGA